MNNFLWLEQWYDEQCDGNWEHLSGIHIDTIDHPGWRVRIDLQGTHPNALLKSMHPTESHLEAEWMDCRIVSNTFEAHGGPLMLGPIIQLFRNWIETQP